MRSTSSSKMFSSLRSVRTLVNKRGNVRNFRSTSLKNMTCTNRHVVLRSRPGVNGVPQPENFSCEPCSSVNTEELGDNEVVIKTCYLSVDPAQRCQMNENTGADYVPPWMLGQTIVGLAGVGSVVASRHSNYQAGDLVYGSPSFPWSDYFIQNMELAKDQFTVLDATFFRNRLPLALSLLGIAGLTAYFGMTEKGQIVNGGHQTCVVSGAAGSCGSIAGQVARLLGCTRVIGICGGGSKRAWLREDLGFDATIDYKTETVATRLKDVTPDGVDVYFDNVGGVISDVVIQRMNTNSHIVLCGQIALYNEDTPHVPPLPPESAEIVQKNNITREEFLVLDYTEKFPEALAQLKEWYLEGKLKVRETITEGLENTGEAFCSMMMGGNIGKQMVHVSNP